MPQKIRMTSNPSLSPEETRRLAELKTQVDDYFTTGAGLYQLINYVRLCTRLDELAILISTYKDNLKIYTDLLDREATARAKLFQIASKLGLTPPKGDVADISGADEDDEF